MRTTKTNGQSLDSLINGLIELLRDKEYRAGTIDNYRQILNQLGQYMNANGISNYEPTVGQGFIEEYLSAHKISQSRRKAMNTVIWRLDDYCVGKYQIQHKTKPAPLLQNSCIELVEVYLRKCRNDGNKESTIATKRRYLQEFFSHLESIGCHDIKNADAAAIGRACLVYNNKDGWAVIRMFLQHLYFCELIGHDCSAIVPRYRKPFRLPSVYSEDEIKRFEDAIDTNTRIGKRDYAMLLLATRLGMRSGDIVNLTLPSLDFENETISISQEKNEVPLVLPMVPAVKDALTKYLDSVRPNSELLYVFLRLNAPFEQVTTSVLRFETSKYFIQAEIDTTNKKHGPHVFRSSLSSSMINHSVPYDVVRKILGHTDPNAVKYYAKVDIERLREYAIEPPAPSGSFRAFLEGRQL